MPLYEHVFMSRQDISQQQVDAITNQYKSVISENGGKVIGSEYWGLKQLCYKIKKNRKAHYVMLNIEAPHVAVAEIERQMSISDDVIRFLTLKVDSHENSPSVMMKSKGDSQ